MSVRRIAVVLLAIGFLTLGGWLAWWFCTENSFWRLHRQVLDRIDSLREDRPANITPDRWEEATDWTATAFANVWPWNSDTHTALEEFSATLEDKVAAGDNLATLRWVWEELERRTVTGRDYAAAWMPVRALNPDPITDESLGALWGLDNCLELDLSDTQVGDAGVHHLRKAQRLGYVNLSGTDVTDAGLALLPEYLEAIWLRDCRIRGIGLADLGRLEALDTLYLDGTDITDEYLSGIRDVSGLVRLSLQRSAISDGGLEHLAPLAGLKCLDLSHTHVTGPGLKHLRGLAELRELNLSETPVTDAGLHPLRELTQLKKLRLGRTQITPAALDHIAKLVELESLGLSNTDISDDGLEYLAALPGLRVLHLEGTAVTAQGLRHLKGLEKLRYLYLPSNVQRGEEFWQLRSALPECQIYLE